MVTTVQTRDYYSQARSEIAPALPAHASRVLDIGCGTGATSTWLRARYAEAEFHGVDVEADAVSVAREKLDSATCIDVETAVLPFAPESFDLILCLDILEHLRDPWRAVRSIAPLLAPGGALLASIPNARNLKLLAPLVLRGDFEYAGSGILDRTHLRFFGRRQAIELIQEGELLTVDAVVPLGTERGRRAYLPNRMTLGMFGAFLTSQYLVRGIRRGPAA